MKRNRIFRKKKKRLSTKYWLLILSGVCIIAIFLSLVFNISGGPLNAVAGYVFVPMQKGINTAGSWLYEKTNDFKTLGEVLDENKELQDQVDELTTQLNRIKLEQYELDNYRELLELDDKYAEYDKVAASVIAMDGTNWFSTFTIDKGSKQGIEKGMNVISGSGLVGIVTDVGPNYAKVRSIIDDSSNVSSMVLTTKDNFNVSGSLQSMNSDKLLPFTELRDENNEVEVGDPVVTSYVSDQYQQGLLIGYIYSIETNSNGLTKSGTIAPVVDFLHIEDVLVITEIKNTGTVESTESTEATEATDNTETESEE
jgi:rod shape-determining protein MreC